MQKNFSMLSAYSYSFFRREQARFACRREGGARGALLQPREVETLHARNAALATRIAELEGRAPSQALQLGLLGVSGLLVQGPESSRQDHPATAIAAPRSSSQGCRGR